MKYFFTFIRALARRENAGVLLALSFAALFAFFLPISFVHHDSNQSVVLSPTPQGLGQGVAACGSSVSSQSCNADGSANDTVTWNFSDVADCVGIAIRGNVNAGSENSGDITGSSASLPCSGTYTFNGLAANQAYSYHFNVETTYTTQQCSGGDHEVCNTYTNYAWADGSSGTASAGGGTITNMSGTIPADGSCVAAAPPSGTITGTGCTLPVGNGSCNASLIWNSYNTASGEADLLVSGAGGPGGPSDVAGSAVDNTVASAAAGPYNWGIYNFHTTTWLASTTYTVLPAPPASMSATCISGNTQAQLTWPAGNGAKVYQLGMWVPNGPCPSGWTTATTQTNPDGTTSSSCTLFNYPNLTVTIPIVDQGGGYGAWAFSTDKYGDTNWNNYASASFSCGVLAADLTAGAITPTSVTQNTTTSFSAPINNIGSAPTGRAFPDIFETATDAVGDGLAEVGTTTSLELLGSSSTTTSISTSFPTAGTVYMRACADRSSLTDTTGVVAESNQLNNCGSWTAITVNPSGGSGNPVVTPTCDVGGTGVTLSWTSVAGATYYPRIQNSLPSCPAGWTWWVGAGTGGCYQNSISATSVHFSPITPGTTYNTWVHTQVGAGPVDWSVNPPPEGTPFSCAASCPVNASCTSAPNACGATNGTCNAGGSCVPPPNTCPLLTLTASPTRVRSGGTTQLQWYAFNVNSCVLPNPAGGGNLDSANADGSGNIATPRNVTSEPINGQTTFTLTCLYNSSSQSKSASINITLIPSYIEPGQ